MDTLVQKLTKELRQAHLKEAKQQINEAIVSLGMNDEERTESYLAKTMANINAAQALKPKDS